MMEPLLLLLLLLGPVLLLLLLLLALGGAPLYLLRASPSAKACPTLPESGGRVLRCTGGGRGGGSGIGGRAGAGAGPLLNGRGGGEVL